MRQQGSTLQTEEQDKTLEELSDVQIGNLSKHTVIKMIKIKDKQNIKSSKGKATNNIQGIPIMLPADFSA